jgi:Arc/MetJ-type ribon-helix-helix transcriptional regulator
LARRGEGRNVRFEPAMLEAIDQAAKDGGFASPSSFIRQAVVNQLQGASKALNDTEERILATLERQSRDIRKLTTAAVLSYASLDTFIKLYLTYQPEIPPEARSASVATAKLRYEKFKADVAREVTGNVAAALREWVDSLGNS